jgi:hypothetical protein
MAPEKPFLVHTHSEITQGLVLTERYDDPRWLFLESSRKGDEPLIVFEPGCGWGETKSSPPLLPVAKNVADLVRYDLLGVSALLFFGDLTQLLKPLKRVGSLFRSQYAWCFDKIEETLFELEDFPISQTWVRKLESLPQYTLAQGRDHVLERLKQIRQVFSS